MTTLSVSTVSSPCSLATATAVVFSFSESGDAVLNLVAGFLYANGHLDVVKAHNQNLYEWLLVFGAFLTQPRQPSWPW